MHTTVHAEQRIEDVWQEMRRHGNKRNYTVTQHCTLFEVIWANEACFVAQKTSK